MQNTLKESITFSGVGVHSGKVITMRLIPTEEDHGIVFKRVDIDGRDAFIPALWNHVVDTRMCTVIANEHGDSVGTIEHVMAALRGCEVDNVLIEIDGPEVPAMDGSSAAFVQGIDRVGIAAQGALRKVIKVLKDISFEKDGKRVTLSPAPRSQFSGEIDFSHPVIGQQSYGLELLNGNFRHDLSEARSFAFENEIEYLRANGLAQGASLDTGIGINDEGVMNEGGLRFKDEFIRHKLLDAVGDLYLAGGVIHGAYDGYKAGHEMNNEILKVLFADDSAWCWETPSMIAAQAVSSSVSEGKSA